MKTIQIPGQKTFQKVLPPAKGVAQTFITGNGFGRAARALDKMALKGTLQKAGITVPFLKVRLNVIDGFNIVLHNRGLNLKSQGFIAVASDKAVDIISNKFRFDVPKNFDDVIAQTNAEVEL